MKVYSDVSTEFVKNNLSKKRNNKTDTENRYNTEDSVEFSSELNNLKKLGNKAANLSSVNKGKVEGIKLKVENGSYKVSSEDIAEKIIEENILG